MQPNTRYAKGPDGRVAYQVTGDAPLDVIFIPDSLSNLEVMWEQPRIAYFLERLASFSRLICFDNPGTGVSDPLPLEKTLSLEQTLDSVRAVMGDANSERAALFGHGDGGPKAMLFAATHPERTSALALADTSARLLRDTDYPCGLPADRVDKFMENFVAAWGTGKIADIAAPSLAGDRQFREWLARYERLCMPPATAAMYRFIFGWDLRPVLKAIRAPTLVLHRKGNRNVRACHGKFIADSIPGARYVELPGEDHYFFVGECDLMLRELREFLTGIREVPDENRVLATVLFTDIVSSTELAAQLGDHAWHALRNQHNLLVRQELTRFRGNEIETAGDSFFATFDGPGRAIRCALSIRDALLRLGIRIRAGLHTGECELMDNKVGGIAVHIAARVLSNAAPEQVLVSSTVRDLVSGSGIRFADAGLHALKGIPGEWRLFAAS